MEFRDLGTVQVAVDGIATAVNGRRLESVLALLVARVGEVVTVDALVDAVWGPSASGRAAQSLESLVWRLRKVLESERVAGETATLLQTDERGYRLAMPPPSVDSHRFLQAAEAVPAFLAAGDAERALDIAETALALWRGQPYLGVPDADWMPPVRARLEEARLALEQLRAAALLKTAQPERALRELGPLLSAHPHREQLWGHRMVALYRCGRQSEALQAFADARAALADELGVDPGPELRALHRRILTQDPALDLRSGDQPLRLPRRRSELVGRATELAELTSLLREHTLVTLTGPGGTGKTRLAVEAAHLSRHPHPDGVWFIELADVEDTDDPAVVWSRIALTLGLAPQPDATTEHVASTFLAHRRVLLVLDNCEQVLDAARAVTDRILDTCPAVTVLITSREPLDLPDEHVLPVPPLPPDLAAALFRQRVGRHLDDHTAVARICAVVDGLPLGLELAAARARTFELAEVADGLERDPIGLTRPGGGPARQLTLYDTVDWSYRRSRPAEQVLHRRLSTISGPITLDAAQALCSVAPLKPGQAMDLLAGLVHRSLLTHLDHREPSRFAQHVPIRAHARTLLTSDEAAAVERARDQWVYDLVHDVRGDGREGQARWYDRLEANHATLTATLIHRPSATGLRIVEALVVYWYDRSPMIEGQRWIAAARRLPDLDGFERACADACYGAGLALNFDAVGALPYLERALTVLPSAGEPRAGDLLVRIGAAAWAADLWKEAEAAARAARAIGERLGDPHLTLRARAVLSACALVAGNTAQAVRDAADVLAENRAVGNHFAALFACVTGGVAAVFARDPDAGLHWTGQAIRHQRALGMRNVGDTLEQRGTHYATAARPDVALRCYAASAAQSEREGRPWPHHPGTTATLDRLRASLSPAEYDRNWDSGTRLGRDTLDDLPEEWG